MIPRLPRSQRRLLISGEIYGKDMMVFDQEKTWSLSEINFAPKGKNMAPNGITIFWQAMFACR